MKIEDKLHDIYAEFKRATWGMESIPSYWIIPVKYKPNLCLGMPTNGLDSSIVGRKFEFIGIRVVWTNDVDEPVLVSTVNDFFHVQ